MSIAWAEELADEFGENFSGIVVCQGGLKSQWLEMIQKFTCTDCLSTKDTHKHRPVKSRKLVCKDCGGEEPEHTHSGHSSVIVIDGTSELERAAQYERCYDEQPLYVIVGYPQVVTDFSAVCKLTQDFVIADEVTVVKNPAAEVTLAFRDAFDRAPFVLGLTGTPMENGRPEEMFQLMTWIDDSVLGRPDIFDMTFVERNKYGVVKGYKNLPVFYELMRPACVSLDADDADVSPFMPKSRAPRRVLIEVDTETARIYNDVIVPELLEDLYEVIRAGVNFDVHGHYSGDSSKGQQQGKIMAKIGALRALLTHPDLLVQAGEDWLADEAAELAAPDDWPMLPKKVKDPKTGKWKTITVPKPYAGSAYAAYLLRDGELDNLLETPKMDEVYHDIDQVMAGECSCCRGLRDAAGRNKLVVFCYHKLVLRILERRYPDTVVRYDGDMTLGARKNAKVRFQTNPSVRVFASSDAGGYGVDLPQANHLFNIDKPFTAGRVTQRNARIRRANLDFFDRVHVRDYLTDGGIDLYYADITEAKQRVETAVRTGYGADAAGRLVVTAQTLTKWLEQHKV